MSEKKTAVVTGANRGIGFEVARQLASDHNMHVVMTARSLEKAEAAAKTLVDAGLDVETAVLDVTDPPSAAALATQLKNAGREVVALVNNAGVFPGSSGSIFDESIDDVMAAIRTNTIGPLNVTKALAPLLRASGSANVVMVSSGLGQLSDMGADAPGYRVSKVGVNALARIFAAEMADDGVRVNSVCPGWVVTDMGGENATRSVDVGAASVVWAATLGDDGPTGGFFRDGTRIDW